VLAVKEPRPFTVVRDEEGFVALERLDNFEYFGQMSTVGTD
jgi:hypothetical protein